jgi:hypothetical protein
MLSGTTAVTVSVAQAYVADVTSQKDGFATSDYLAEQRASFGNAVGSSGVVFIVSVVIAVVTIPLILSFKRVSRDETSG